MKARYNYTKLHCVDLFACVMSRGNFLMNLSLAPGGRFLKLQRCLCESPFLFPGGLGFGSLRSPHEERSLGRDGEGAKGLGFVLTSA